MIGVIADAAEQDVVREFFELFKTPWEFHRGHRHYDVVLCSGGGRFDGSAKIVVVYGGTHTIFDDDLRIQTGQQRSHASVLSYRETRIPIYGDTIAFPQTEDSFLTDEDSKEAIAHLDMSEEAAICRIGYDLFGEVRRLLTVGQPASNANIPTLELHVALLRGLITGAGIPLIEIPPVPEGYNCIVCLTHDVDHPSIRQHKWDHTTVGFLCRAVFGSFRNLMRGRITIRDLVTNWGAALKLPLVHLGLAKDFWREFDDRYLELEKGLPSTFFVIPFKDRSGKSSDGPVPKFRAARYAAQDIADAMRKLLTAGCEIGLHGIDAWLDSSAGREEVEEIRRLTGASEVGVRMHWLCYGEHSPEALERAGAAYDSTIGYNETVGYRAGTMQAYKSLAASHFLELPLHVMDTALFYPAYLDLSPQQARTLLGQLVDNVVSIGGCLTINWHDRSIAPERLWQASYRDLIEDLKSRGAWFATAGQAVSWFRKRRSVVFESDATALNAVRARVAPDQNDSLPGLRLRIYKASTSCHIGAYATDNYLDWVLNESLETQVPCWVNC